MPRKIPRLVWPAAVLAYIIYFYGLGTAGMLGPDEPRYASIGREMARSGDWVTPRLWGHAWFEKPALLYWMTAAGFRAGLGPDLAPRLPVALMAVAFLVFYWWMLQRLFGSAAAWFATLILGTSVEWVVFSQVGVTDLPLAATFSAAMLLALPWVVKGDERLLPWAGAMLGLAVLAKGLVPLVLAAPLVLGVWRRPASASARAMLRTLIPLLAVAVPWYALCYRANGRLFLYDFFWVHHFERATSQSLMHVEPWWFYGKVFLGALIPWTPLLVPAVRPALYRERGRFFLVLIVVWGLVFFSAALNKLPGYLMPLMPGAAALLALALLETRRAAALLVCCSLLLVVFPVIAPALPAAVASGLSKAPVPHFQWTWLLPLAIGAASWFLDARKRRVAALFSIAAAAGLGVLYLKRSAMPEVDRLASSRHLWQEVANQPGDVCVENILRNWRYPLNYYSVTPLPECADQPRPVHILQIPGEAPRVAAHTASTAAPVDPGGSGIILSRSSGTNP